jgi:hypothetical protein
MARPKQIASAAKATAPTPQSQRHIILAPISAPRRAQGRTHLASGKVAPLPAVLAFLGGRSRTVGLGEWDFASQKATLLRGEIPRQELLEVGRCFAPFRCRNCPNTTAAICADSAS